MSNKSWYDDHDETNLLIRSKREEIPPTVYCGLGTAKTDGSKIKLSVKNGSSMIARKTGYASKTNLTHNQNYYNPVHSQLRLTNKSESARVKITPGLSLSTNKDNSSNIIRDKRNIYNHSYDNNSYAETNANEFSCNNNTNFNQHLNNVNQVTQKQQQIQPPQQPGCRVSKVQQLHNDVYGNKRNISNETTNSSSSDNANTNSNNKTLSMNTNIKTYARKNTTGCINPQKTIYNDNITNSNSMYTSNDPQIDSTRGYTTRQRISLGSSLNTTMYGHAQQSNSYHDISYNTTTSSTSKKRQLRASNRNTNDVIDLVSDDDDGNNKSIATMYKDMLGNNVISRQQYEGSTKLHHRSYRIHVDYIYLGLYPYQTHSLVNQLYIRLDTYDFQGLGLLLGIAQPPNNNNNSSGDLLNEETILEFEEIPYKLIEKIHIYLMPEDENKAYILLMVSAELKLKSISVGCNCILDPTLQRNTVKVPSKYILVVLPTANALIFLNEVKKISALRDAISKIRDNDVITTNNKPMSTSSFLAAHDRNLSNQPFDIQELKIRIKEEKEREIKNEQKIEKRRKRYSTDIIEEPTDIITYTYYPYELGAHDVITISNGDMKRLAPGIYFNDNLVDLRIKHTLLNLPIKDRNVIYAFNCMFYTKLLEVSNKKRGYELVCRWTKNFDLFGLKFTFIPINASVHWSLAVILHANAHLKFVDQFHRRYLIKRHRQLRLLHKQQERLINHSSNNNNNNNSNNSDEELVNTQEDDSLLGGDDEFVEEEKDDVDVCYKESENQTCLLHMDSLRMHNSKTIGQWLQSYLHYEWQDKKMDVVEAEFNTKYDIQNNCYNIDILQHKSILKLEKENEQGRYRIFEKIKMISCPVPIQGNGTDCGVYVTRFAEMVVEKRFVITSIAQDIQENFASYFSRNEFTQEDVDLLRPATKLMIDEFRSKYLELRPNLTAEEGLAYASATQESATSSALQQQLLQDQQEQLQLQDEQQLQSQQQQEEYHTALNDSETISSDLEPVGQQSSSSGLLHHNIIQTEMNGFQSSTTIKIQEDVIEESTDITTTTTSSIKIVVATEEQQPQQHNRRHRRKEKQIIDSLVNGGSLTSQQEQQDKFTYNEIEDRNETEDEEYWYKNNKNNIKNNLPKEKENSHQGINSMDYLNKKSNNKTNAISESNIINKPISNIKAYDNHYIQRVDKEEKNVNKHLSRKAFLNDITSIPRNALGVKYKDQEDEKVDSLYDDNNMNNNNNNNLLIQINSKRIIQVNHKNNHKYFEEEEEEVTDVPNHNNDKNDINNNNNNNNGITSIDTAVDSSEEEIESSSSPFKNNTSTSSQDDNNNEIIMKIYTISSNNNSNSTDESLLNNMIHKPVKIITNSKRKRDDIDKIL